MALSHTEPSSRVVVFDLGGVMIELAHGWTHACSLANVLPPTVPFDEERIAAMWALAREHESDRMDAADYLQRLGALLDATWSLEQTRAAFLAIIQDEVPGIGDLVADLKARDVLTACLSNTSRLHWMHLEDPARYPTIAALDVRLTSFDLRAYKPDEEIFARAEARLAAPPASIIFFDDNAPNVEVAAARGWRAHHVTRDVPPAEQMRAVLAEALRWSEPALAPRERG